MKAARDKERKKCTHCCSGCLCTAKWKHDCIRTKLISVGFPFHQKDCLLDLTNVLLYLFSLFFLSVQIFEAVGEWCHFWSNVLRRWKCLPWGNYVLLHRARLLFSYCALQLASAVSADNKIFALQGHLSYGIFCQCGHLRALMLSKLQRSNLSRRDGENQPFSCSNSKIIFPKRNQLYSMSLSNWSNKKLMEDLKKIFPVTFVLERLIR